MNEVNHRRIVVNRRGGPEVLEVVVEPIPEPGEGEIRIKALAAGVRYGSWALVGLLAIAFVVYRRLRIRNRPSVEDTLTDLKE